MDKPSTRSSIPDYPNEKQRKIMQKLAAKEEKLAYSYYHKRLDVLGHDQIELRLFGLDALEKALQYSSLSLTAGDAINIASLIKLKPTDKISDLVKTVFKYHYDFDVPTFILTFVGSLAPSQVYIEAFLEELKLKRRK